MKKALTLLLALVLLLGALHPALAESGGLPSCFIPQVSAQYFNGLLEQVFQSMGATDAAARAERFRLTRASIEGNALYISSGDGSVELSALYTDGTPDVAAPAGTLGISVVKDVEQADLLAIEATFAVVLSETDPSADLDELLNWFSAATGTAEAKPMQGYTLVHVRNDRGDIFSVVPDEAPAPTEAPAATDAPISRMGPLTLGPIAAPDPTSAPAPTAAPDPTAAPLSGALLTWEGITLKPVRYKIFELSDGKMSLWVYLRVVNDSDHKLDVFFRDVTMEGVPMYAAGVFDLPPHTDGGDDTDEFFLVKPDQDVAGGNRAILNGKEVSCRIELKDADTREVLYEQKVTVDLSGLKGERDLRNDAPSATRKPSATVRPTAKPSSYYTLCKGDEGDAVKRLQKRLIELGYLNDKADGEFGPNTATAVRAFNEANGLGSSDIASPETQERLFSASAKPYEEPWVPLIFIDNARGEWKNRSKDKLAFRVKVTNSSRRYTVKAFELSFYATDVWGDKVYGSTTYVGTTTKKVKPGKSAFSEYFLLPDRSRISTVWCGISKVIFTDGTVRENSSIDYWQWSIK